MDTRNVLVSQLTYDRATLANRLNDAAGLAIMEHDFGCAAALLTLASQFAITNEGRQVLIDRAWELKCEGEARMRTRH